MNFNKKHYLKINCIHKNKNQFRIKSTIIWKLYDQDICQVEAKD